MPRFRGAFTVNYDYLIEVEAENQEEAQAKFDSFTTIEDLEKASELSSKEESASVDWIKEEE